MSAQISLLDERTHPNPTGEEVPFGEAGLRSDFSEGLLGGKMQGYSQMREQHTKGKRLKVLLGWELWRSHYKNLDWNLIGSNVSLMGVFLVWIHFM